MGIIKNYCKPHSLNILFIVMLKAIGTAGELIIPMGFVYMMDTVVPQNSIALLIQWGFIMLGIALFAFIISLIVSHLSVKFGVDLAKNLREDLFLKSITLDCEQIDKLGISSITSRLTMDIALLQNFITKLMTKGIRMLIIFTGSLASITILDSKLAFIMFCTVPFIGVVVYFTTTISFKKFKETKKVNDNLTKAIRDNVMGIRVVKALSKFNYEQQKFENVNSLLEEKSINASKVNIIGSPLMNLIVNFGMVATITLGAYWVKQGESSPASIIAFMSYATMILNSIVSIGQFFTAFSRAGAASSRITEILDIKSREYSSSEKIKNSEAYIEFKNVSFSYNNSCSYNNIGNNTGNTTDNTTNSNIDNNTISENIILENISFKIQEGEMLGIIGMTGAGKSTILNLLLRLYEPNSGEIFVKGASLNTYSSEELYKIFAVVFQSDVIFADSVNNNISFGREINEERIKFAAQSAQAELFINNLTDKYEALVNVRGQNISGGEKQRLLISRALAGEPNILMLDDSTSALDYKTDANLRRELDNNFKNTTKILVSQRISSIMNAEQILVLDNGKILNLGTHDKLMQTCDIYKEIADLQLGDNNLYA